MNQAVRIHRSGGPEELRLEAVEQPVPGPGEALVRQAFAGVNFVDVYHRIGLYPLPAFPVILGVEGAGRIEALGAGCEGLSVGDRIAYAMPAVGGYTVLRTVPGGRLMSLPDNVPLDVAAGSMLRGLTAYMLLKSVFPVGPGTVVLVHAAAGGLGLLLCQWAKYLGATVIGTVGSAQKAELARAAGADHIIFYRETDFVSAVLDLTGGKGADVAYDGIGGDILARTFKAVRPFGMIASIGRAGGPIPPLDVSQLGPRCLARPSVMAYMVDLSAYRAAAETYLDLLAQGVLKVTIGAHYPLAEARRGHEDLEAGRTSGSLVLEI